MANFVRLRSEGITWRVVGGEIIGLDLRSSVYFTTNKTGALLWPLLVEGSSIDRLQQALIDAYGLSDELAARDLTEFLRPLSDAGLLEPSAAQ
jgi:hypothetical protein